MGIVRQIVLWLALAAIVLLAVLSIAGALIGADRAKELFNSIPAVVYWVLLGIWLLVGFVAFPRLVKSPPSFIMHLGPLFILVGAMWGSEGAHAARQAVFRAVRPTLSEVLGASRAQQVLSDWLGFDKVPSGYMVLREEQEDSRIVDKETHEVIAELPFTVRLNSFTIEYYRARDERWRLTAVLPVFDAAGNLVDSRREPLAWTEGRDVPIPDTPIRVRVLQYLPHAAPVFEKGAAPYVEITPPDGQTVTLPGEVGREVDLKEPPLKVRVEKVFQNLVVQGAGAEREVTDAPGEGSNPAVAVSVTKPGAPARTRYLIARMPMHGQSGEGVAMRCVLPQPAGARADPASRVPAMQVQIWSDGRPVRAWLMVLEDGRPAGLALGPLFEGESGKAQEAGGLPALYLSPPARDVKAYKSDVDILRDYRRVAHKVVEVNAPMHYGGYHFYQHSYGTEPEVYSALLVVSDSGLLAVWFGFAMLVGAAFWRMWGRSMWRPVARGGR